MGKSSLAHHLEKPVHKHNGCFCSGKFDLQDRSLPYSGISEALIRLFEHILASRAKDRDRFDQVQSNVVTAIGEECQHVLRTLIPNLHELFAHETNHSPEASKDQDLIDETNPLGSAQEKAKLLFLLQQLIRVVCDIYGPVVILLDDLQWVDTASLELLHALATDRDIRGLLLLGCYRDNEVGDNHKLSLFLKELEKPGKETVRVTYVTVDNLDEHVITDMLQDLLQSTDSSETQNLARILHERTFGNIFFMIQFLKSLREMKLLTYNLAQCQWRWNNEEIKSRMNVTDNVAALMSLDMKSQLSNNARRVLEIAACLGNESDESTIVLVVTKMSEKGLENGHSWEAPARADDVQVKQWLQDCVEGGYLYRQSDHYRFVHDIVQDAAISLIGDDMLELLQFNVGKVLVENLSTEQVEQSLFVMVDFLNHGAKLETLEENRSMLVSLNLQAGKKALKSSAFEAAAKYLAFGIELLGHDCWRDENYDLSLDLFSTAAQAEYCNGNLDESEAYIYVVLAQKGRLHDKLPVYVTLIDIYKAQEQHTKALQTNLSVLKQLGAKFGPVGLLPLATVSSLRKTRRMLRNMDADDLLNLPSMSDKTKLMAMKLMDIALVSSKLYFLRLAFSSMSRETNLTITAPLSECLLHAEFPIPSFD